MMKINKSFVLIREVSNLLDSLDPSKIDTLFSRRHEFWDKFRCLLNELTIPNRYSNEQCTSNVFYSKYYTGPNSIEDQIDKIASVFDLRSKNALSYVKNNPFSEYGAEGLFAFVSLSALTRCFSSMVGDQSYMSMTNHVNREITQRRNFINCFDALGEFCGLKMTSRTKRALDLLEAVQPGDIWVIPAQLGYKNRGQSPRLSCDNFSDNEFGLPSFMMACVILTHPELLLDKYGSLGFRCPGDTCRDYNLRPSTPHYSFLTYGSVRFSGNLDSSGSHDFGNPSGFLPKHNFIP